MRKKKETSGNSLIVVLILMATLIAFVGVSVDYTQNVGRHSSRARTNVSAQAVGEACLELAFAEWRQISRNTTPTLPDPNNYSYYYESGPPIYELSGNSPPPTSAFANIALPTAAMFPDIPNFTATAANDQNFTVSNFKIQAIDPQFTLTTADPPVSAFPASKEPPHSMPEGGYYSLNCSRPRSWYYLASADVTLPTPSGTVTTRMRRIFEKKIVRPMGYFMFFNDDLELSPSSPLTIYGPVHTNAKLYTGSNNLTFNSTQPALQGYGTVAVSQAGTNPSRTLGITYNDDWITGFKAGDTFHAAGSATAPVIATNTTVTRGSNYQMYGWEPTQFDGSAEPTNKSGPHEVIEKQVTPVSTYPDPLWVPVWDAGNRTFPMKPTSMQRYHDQAGIRIEIDSANVVTIRNKAGTLLSSTSVGPPPYNTGYAVLHDMWKTALGATPSNATIPVAKTITGCSTTAGSADITSSGFATTDVGRYITGPGIPEGAWVVSRTNSKGTISAAAKTSGSSLTMRLNGTNSIQDNREGGAVDLITIDFGVFKSWYPRTGFACTDPKRYTAGTAENFLVVHISALPVAGRKRALRFVNGGSHTQYMYDSCPTNAPDKWAVNQFKVITLITDNPVYIQGDFNSSRSIAAGTDTITPACNFAGPLTTIFRNSSSGTPIPGTTMIQTNNRLPFWLICDSVTVLSNAWKDGNAALALSSRVASNTTIEASIVTGNVPTSASNGYSGGAENIIRLMEDWNGKYFTFVGNIVQLYPSKQAVGRWVPPGTTGNVYKEPLRNWYWDPFSIVNADDFTYAIAYRKHKWSPYP